MPTGTRGRSWKEDSSYIPKDNLPSKFIGDFSPVKKVKVLDAIRRNDLVSDKECKKELETFRSNVVGIVMQGHISQDNLATFIGDRSRGGLQDRETIQRYYYYITNGIDTQHVADMEDKWLNNVKRMLPDKLKLSHQLVLASLSNEMREDYHMSVKKAIVDFVLKDPREKFDPNQEDAPIKDDFVSIRKSTDTWQQSYIDSSSFIRENLMIINPTVSAILDIWNNYKTARLFEMDTILGKGTAFEIRNLKSLMLQRFDKTMEKLLITWYPEILSVFYLGAKNQEWTSIPTNRMEIFFRSISLIMADQLRQIVRNTVEDFLSLFDDSTHVQPDSDIPKSLSFVVRLNLDETNILFEPQLLDIVHAAESILEALFIAADKVPRIETQLFAQGQTSGGNKSLLLSAKPEQCVRVAFEETYPKFCNEAREKLHQCLNAKLAEPNSYISQFDGFKSLITKSAYSEVQSFLDEDPNVEALIEVISIFHFNTRQLKATETCLLKFNAPFRKLFLCRFLSFIVKI